MYSTNSYVLHRDKGIWGEDAEDFKPERWQTRRQGWEYQAFGGKSYLALSPSERRLTPESCSGARTCPGQALVLMEIGYIVVRLLQEFRWIESRDDRPWVENLKLTMSNKNGIVVGFIPQQPSDGV